MKITVYIFLMVLNSLFFSCSNKTIRETSENEDIHLKWYKAYEDDTIEKARIGLYWCYSSVGAQILNTTVLTSKNAIFSVNVNNIGLNENALTKIKILHSKIKATEEYKLKKTIDLGRYISLLIGASEHYYAITAIPKKLDDILANYSLNTSKGYVNNSLVSMEDRIIEYSNQEQTKQLFLSSEFDTENDTIVEYETVEIMENGQLKFGIFDASKNRINVANSKHTTAGKPAKCMWCHESNINELFSTQNDFPGFLTYRQLSDTLIKFNTSLKKQQNSFTKGVVFKNTQDHVMLELAYITFMEPSVTRLSNEWNITENEIENLLSELKTHKHHEFTFLGMLYDRNEVEKFAPFKSLKTSTNIREASTTEVNHLE